MIKKIFIIIFLAIVLIIGYWYYRSRQVSPYIGNFEECVRMGGQIQESYPAKCIYKNGQVFIQKVDEKTVATTAQSDLEDINGEVASTDCSGIEFKDFSVEEIYNGKIAQPDFSSVPELNNFRQIIKEAITNKPNFAGHYSIVELSCGSNCQQHAYIDLATGKITMLEPRSNYGIAIEPDSKLIIINPPQNLPDNSDEPVDIIYYQLSSDSKLSEVCRQKQQPAKKLDSGLKVYSDKELGISFDYPASMILSQTATSTKTATNTKDLVLIVTKTKITDLNDTMGYDQATAQKDIVALKDGKFGERIDWPVENSKNVVKYGDINAKDFTVLRRFEICDVVFERKLIIYINDYQVAITLIGNKEAITTSMSEYFKIDKINCGQELIWQDSDGFYDTLKEKNGSIPAQLWFDSFEEIIQTIKIAK